MPNTARKNTPEIPTKIYNMINNSKEPVRVTKDGYADVVIMDAKAYEEYERKASLLEIIEKLEEAEEDVKNGRVINFKDSMNDFAKQHDFKL